MLAFVRQGGGPHAASCLYRKICWASAARGHYIGRAANGRGLPLPYAGCQSNHNLVVSSDYMEAVSSGAAGRMRGFRRPRTASLVPRRNKANSAKSVELQQIKRDDVNVTRLSERCLHLGVLRFLTQHGA